MRDIGKSIVYLNRTLGLELCWDLPKASALHLVV